MVDAWPDLPANIRSAVLAVVRSSRLADALSGGGPESRTVAGGTVLVAAKKKARKRATGDRRETECGS